MELSQYQCCLGPEVDDVYEEGNHYCGHQRCKVCHSWRNRSCSLQCWGCSWYWETFTGNNTMSINRKKLMKNFDKKMMKKAVNKKLMEKSWWNYLSHSICRTLHPGCCIGAKYPVMTRPVGKKTIIVIKRNSIIIFSPRITVSNIFLELD